MVSYVHQFFLAWLLLLNFDVILPSLMSYEHQVTWNLRWAVGTNETQELSEFVLEFQVLQKLINFHLRDFDGVGF